MAGLDAIEERDGELVVGALVRQQTLLDDPLAARSWPLIGEALQYAGYRETRHRGTVGGSLAFAAAWAELTAVTVALDATIEARSQRGARSIAAREFFRGPNETALEDDELITAVRFPAPQERSGSAFHEVERALSRLRAGRRGGGRHARRGRRVQLGDARAAARRGHAAPGRHRRDRARRRRSTRTRSRP